jgi:glycosyltransferase involved in cell wall biosynthesis
MIGLILASRMPRRVPVVQTMHGWGIRKTAEQQAADLGVLRLLDAVVTTSEASKRLLVEMGLKAETIRVIPCGLAAEPPAPSQDRVMDELRNARAGGRRVILCIGSVTANKNQRLLLEALPAVQRAQPVLCALIGEDDGTEKIEETGSVRLFGHRPDAASYLHAADLLVSPSRTEGQGLAVLEAFRAGVPVVASDIPALNELVSAPECGMTFESRSSDSLATAVNRALALPEKERATMVERAALRFKDRFTLGAMHKAHAALYRTCV